MFCPSPPVGRCPTLSATRPLALFFPFNLFPFSFSTFSLYTFPFQFSIFNSQLSTSFLLFRHTWYELTMFCHSTYVPGPTDESGFR